MLAYRHAFHAGNHGDVLKHVVLAAVLRYMTQKDAPMAVIDTHAGAGGYALESRYAAKHAEHEGGVSALAATTEVLPSVLRDYLDLIRDFNGVARIPPITQYPGSPAIAATLLRDGDAMRLFEMHPTDERILRGYLAHRPDTKVLMSDGFTGLARELPPTSRRGVVIIDPSYELKTDYAKTVGALRDGIKRFATGTFIVWYPRLQTVDAVQLPKRLINAAAAAPKGWLHAQLTVQRAASDGFGMTGSGVIVVNPPFTLAQQLHEALPVLAKVLGVDGAGRHMVQSGGGDQPAKPGGGKASPSRD